MVRNRKEYCPLGKLMAQKMYILDLTSSSLAKRAKMTQSHISWIMQGKVIPAPDTIKKISDALNLDFNEAREAASKGFWK